MAGNSDSSRFQSLDKPIEDILPSTKTKTRAKTDRDAKLLTEFLLKKNGQRKPQEIQPEELNWYLGEFTLSVKRKDGQDYKPSSPRGLFCVLIGI